MKKNLNKYRGPGAKFIGADKVIKVLAFNQNISKDKKYTVCYEDRFSGLLEASLDDFVGGDIPYHRIQLFKLNGEVVWDRKNKFTII